MTSLYSIALRHYRRLSTAASTVADASTTAKPLTLTQTKNRLKKARDPDEALNIYNSFITGNHATTAAANAVYIQDYVVRLLAKSRRFSDIETLLEYLKSSSHVTQEKFLDALIRSYGAAGMFENALKTYEQMDEFGTPRSALSFNAILLACVRSKLYDRVITYFDEFPAKFGFSPNKFSYGILIKAHCDMGSPEIAIDKLNEMQGKGFEIDNLAINIIFHYFLFNGKTEEAEKFRAEMVKENGFKPDVSAYNVRLQSIQHGDTGGFSRIIEEMNSVGIQYNGITYNSIIKFYCENGMTKEANETYDEMFKQKGCKPFSNTYRALVNHNCNVGEFVTACKVFRTSLQYVMVLDFDMLKFLVEELAKAGHEKEAKDLIIRCMQERYSPNLLESCGQLAEALGLVLGNEDLGLDKIESGADSRETVKFSESPKTINVNPPTSSQAMIQNRKEERLTPWDWILKRSKKVNWLPMGLKKLIWAK